MARELHIVTHSHWDREWHQTFQQFRLRLVTLLDQVLEMLASDPALGYFTLDGQTIMLDDYLEIRPERRIELSSRIGEGRLLIGPWYVHPDEFLVSGEALIRNLLEGQSKCREYGGRMAVGYVPDQFGHIAQLPQIWQGFGIDSSVLWRGMDTTESRAALNWESPDGSSVLLIPLPHGYNNAEHLPQTGPALAERLRSLAGATEVGTPASELQPLLLMHGGDHTIPQRQLPTAIRDARNALGGDYALIESTLPTYLDAVRAFGPPSRRIVGELRSSRHSFLLTGVTSSRLWIKQRNNATQMLLERQAEPLSAVATALGISSSGNELRQSWRYLLQNQPHDSICGCSIDQVHHEMVTRFDWSEQIATAVRDQALSAIAQQINTAIPGANDPRTLAIVVFNGAPSAKRGISTTALRLAGEAASYELIDTHGRHVPHEWLGEAGEPSTTVEMPLADLPDRQTLLEQIDGNRVMGMGFQDITMRTLGETLHLELTVGDQALLTRADIELALKDAEGLVNEAGCTRVAAVIARSSELQLSALVDVPPFGFTTLLLRPRAKPNPVNPPKKAVAEGRLMIENEYYRVEVDNESGHLTITDQRSGLKIGPVNVFHDQGEAGDLYTHYPPVVDLEAITELKPHVEQHLGPLGSSLLINQTMQVPVALGESRLERSADTVTTPILTTVTLLPGDRMVRFTVQFDNRAQDHRLRVHATVPFSVDHVHAADSFGLVRRAAQPDTTEEWTEKPTGTAPHQGFLIIHNPQAGLMLAASGLPEYEVVPQEDGTTQVALTLLRSTGWLSRGDLPVRPADAGPPLATPEGQCLGPTTAHYALSFGTDPWRTLLPDAHAYPVELCAISAQCREGSLPTAASFVRVLEDAILISAYKTADDGRGSILRVYNEDATGITAHIQLLLPATRITRVTLAEIDMEVLYVGTPTVEFTLAMHPHSIVTLRLERER